MPRLEQVLRGVKYMQARGERKGKARLPISIDIQGGLAEEGIPGLSNAVGSRLSMFLWIF